MTHTLPPNPQIPAIIELSKVDSTNNYALQQIREGLAYNGLAVFAHEQYAGKGQRGKTWETESGQSIHLSLIIEPEGLSLNNQFILSALVATHVRRFLSNLIKTDFFIKWPNDLYFQDRKAGGILIENIITGKNWSWAVAGIGLNINQEQFSPELKNAISLKQATGKHYDCLELAKALRTEIFDGFSALTEGLEKAADMNLQEYNQFLFKKNQQIDFEERGVRKKGVVVEVTDKGQLIIEAEKRYSFDFGTIKWIV